MAHDDPEKLARDIREQALTAENIRLALARALDAAGPGAAEADWALAGDLASDYADAVCWLRAMLGRQRRGEER